MIISIGKKIVSSAFALILAFGVPGASAASASGISATPTASTVLVNGRQVAFDAYNISGSNYFKLRDLAFVLNGTEKQFRIDWVTTANLIIITRETPYTVVGGEMSSKGSAVRSAVPSTLKVVLDGKELKVRAYEIGGNNYFKLRDIGQALDFGVDWDEARKMIVIDTGKGYTPEVGPTRLEETADMGQEYLDSIIFLGDSTTYALQAYGVLSGGTRTTQVWTPANRTFSLFNQKNILILYPETKQNITIESAVSIKKPEYMIITLGINGVSSMSEDYFKSEYMALIDRILDASPDTKIILNTIYPVSRNYKSISNSSINMGNTWIFSIAEEMGLRYLDTASALKDAEGYLPQAYQNGDGLHLSLEALNTVVNYIRTHGYR